MGSGGMGVKPAETETLYDEQNASLLLATGGTIASTRRRRRVCADARTRAELIAGIQFPCEISAAGRVLPGFQQHAAGGMVRAGAGRSRRARKDCDGVVITHGTDTMAYTASVLSFMLAGSAISPSILTGSQIPIGDALSDARGNLRRAVEAAMQPITRRVCVL